MDFSQMKEQLRQSLQPKRFEHSVAVSETALMLARHYGIDEDKAALAGLLHDCARKYPTKDFVDVAKKLDMSKYELAIRETKTAEVIQEVSTMKSEIGVLYLSEFNRKSMEKLFKSANLELHPLITCKAYVYLWIDHPLAKEPYLTLEQLEHYPCLSFEQGEHNSFYYSEEMFSTEVRSKNIRVRDRATLFNLLIGLNGYTISSGVIDKELNGENIIAVPLVEEGEMHIGYVTHKKTKPSRLGAIYLEALKRHEQ